MSAGQEPGRGLVHSASRLEVSHATAVMQASARAARIPPLAEDVLPGARMQPLSGFSSLQVAGLRVSVVYCLLVQPQFFAL